MDTSEAATACSQVLTEIEEAVIVDRSFLETVLTGVIADGHVLLEDVPGTGKTLTANSLATALGLSFSRIQFTPDLLPGDITGSQIYNENAGTFEFDQGPIFANVVLADEINRAPPKTQAALLEAMEEGQVTVGGETRKLPDPFFVIATQNPVEQEGTFELPEAQLDRFMMKSSMGYPDREGELELLDRREERMTSTPSVEPVMDEDTVLNLQEVPERVRVDQKIKEYIVDLGRETRTHSRVAVGVSPRGIQRLYEAARAHAVVAGRDYTAPEDVKAVARPVLEHRLILTSEARVESVEKADVLDEILDSVAVPAVAD